MKASLVPTLALVLATVSCSQPTVQDDVTPSRRYLLSAFATGSDSIGTTYCQVAALLPVHRSVRDHWKDTVAVYVTRERLTAGSRVDTTATSMIVEVTSSPTDSLSVTLRGVFDLDLRGKATNSVEASGTWNCDDGVPLSQRLSGAPRGIWLLLPDRYSVD